MTAWATIDANQILPSELTSAVQAMAELLTSGLEALKAGASLASGIPSLPSTPDPIAAVVNAVLDTLEGLLKAGRVHVLAIPIAKTPPTPTQAPLPPTIQDLQAALDVDLGTVTPASAAAYADIVARTGGNAGFYSAFAESLMDLSDPNRPQYEGQSDAVVMATLLVGAPSFASIVSAASTLETLIKPRGSANSMVARTVPVPQNLVARVVGASSGKGVGVRLDWDPPKDAFQARYFPGVTITVKRYAVIRTTDPKAQSARGVLDLFSTQALTEGLTSGDAKVIAVGSGANSAYLDESISDPKVPTYYAIAWECATLEEGKVDTLAFDKLSNVVKIAPRAPTPPQTGKSPNWYATEAPIEVFPTVANAARRLIEESRVLLAPKSSPKDRIADAAKLVTASADRLSSRATTLMEDVARLSAALSRPMPSLHVTMMSSATGGNAYLLAELAKRLNDTSDPTRPPFDHGGYVCGICLVAGAPRLADLAAIIAFFESLFGPADASNPLMGILDAVDTLVTQEETTVFDPGMQPTSPEGIDPLTGRPPVASTPAIADDGTAVAGDDPRNPDAGDTNVTPTSELC